MFSPYEFVRRDSVWILGVLALRIRRARLSMDSRCSRLTNSQGETQYGFSVFSPYEFVRRDSVRILGVLAIRIRNARTMKINGPTRFASDSPGVVPSRRSERCFPGGEESLFNTTRTLHRDVVRE